MPGTLEQYEQIVGKIGIRQLRQLARHIDGSSVVHVNSTKQGGGVAEILSWMIPLMNELGINASWETIEGNPDFFHVTKSFHNGLQGNPVDLKAKNYKDYEDTNVENAKRLRPILEKADFVVIHDPQPAFLLRLCPDRKGQWMWRCHIDVSTPHRPIWKYLRPIVEEYDASVFSIPEFALPLRHHQTIIAPSIDPLADKNKDLDEATIQATLDRFNIDATRPVITQISRFDRFKDPVGVIKAYKMAKEYFHSAQLVLAGGGATDDPEGKAVLEEVEEAASGDDDIHVLNLPPDAHEIINGIQRGSDIILQKSTREGFGLTVTEGLWKGRPVIGGDTGGIRLQIYNNHTGFRVQTPEGCAHRIRYLLSNQETAERIGRTGKEYVRENFLLTRHLREYFTMMVGLKFGLGHRLIAG